MASGRIRVLLAALVIGVAAGACSTDYDSETAPTVRVDDAWARSSAPAATNGAVYFVVTSETGRALVGADVDGLIAARAELHETMEDAGTMGMHELERIELPAGEAIALEPGSRHVMLVDLAEPLVSGETFILTLRFDRGAPFEVEVVVRDEAP